MKRGREGKLDTIEAMANCLVLLSRGRWFDTNNSPSRVFECRTCNRQFPSFQSLGGHRASHKKPRLTKGDAGQSQTSLAKPKTHECSICGLEFAIGQALGGHMRRHRAGGLNDSQPPLSAVSPTQVPVVKKSSTSKRVLCLDLNLTPLENDLEFQLGKVTPTLDFYL